MKRQNSLYRTFDRPFFDPPTCVTVNGVRYPIRWGFETAILFSEYVDRSEDDDERFLETVLSLWYPHIPEDRDAALNEAIRFYCGGALPGKGYYIPAPEASTDREELYFRFLKHYGIDLNRQELHWWIFRRLAKNLLDTGGKSHEPYRY